MRWQAVWFLPPMAFLWALVQTLSWQWAICFGVIAIPLGRWIDRENYQHNRQTIRRGWWGE